MHYAFRKTKLSDTHLQEELEEIGKQILQKLDRSPLAAKAMGCQLSRRLEANFWKVALEQGNLRDTQKALIWSYQRLDAPLQRCFSYFNLFPKGYWFEAESLIYLWMAEGFTGKLNDSRRMEDIGKDYLDELVSGSFLQLQYPFGIALYGMHDLFHDLAEEVSEEDYFRIEDDQVKEIPRTIRHLSIWSETMGKCSRDFHKLENLRTLLVGQLSNNDMNLLIPAIEKFKKLRVLQLSYLATELLPKYVGGLKHLRYLDICYSNVKELPVSLGKLHHLQILKLSRVGPPLALPRSLTNLSNLRCLSAESEALATLPDIGKLPSLQGFRTFYVKKEKGYDIGQLKNLNELRGSLTIYDLQNVEGKDQAIEASLKDKKHLDRLRLWWAGSDGNLDMEVLEGLRPPQNLTDLQIYGCQSLGCPSWLIHEGCLENLRSLSLKDTSFEDLPTISKLFPRCRELKIQILLNLRTLPFLPQSLEKLVIDSCPLLVFVSDEELQSSAERKKSIMTIAQSFQLKLEIGFLVSEYFFVLALMESEKVDIPEKLETCWTNLVTPVNSLILMEAYCCCQEQRLEAIFARKNESQLILPSALQHLKFRFINITDGALSLCLGGLTSLKSLKLDGISTITKVPADHLMSLCYLKIRDCLCLKSLGALHSLFSLKRLCIDGCPCLELELMESDGQILLPHSLQSLEIYKSTNAKKFAIGDLPDLNHIKVGALPLLESLSLSGLTALSKLVIQNCSELSALDCSQALNSSFRKLRIHNVPKLASVSLSEAVHFSTVDKLSIDSDAKLGVLFSGSSECLSALRSLKMSSCAESSFHEEHFNCLTSLKELELVDCKVYSLPMSLKNLSSLEILKLSNCTHISSLLPDLPDSLKTLWLSDCPGISSLPMRLPESLRKIRISGCPVLKKRCREAKGEDWSKIAHIHFRDID